ncbi:MAG TPA: argininosuccinate synthase [Alphaproteobacteria bacterium]|nr:argininosuccinate synthase [Rhodospirillaceae bacterium]HRJ11848.1 argininosuccinate synthase [Alphaproteobacteria bacterium]
MADKKRCILAFSGGLDTSFCALWLADQGYEVITVTVDTGTFEKGEAEKVAARARELGAAKHITFDGRQKFFDTVLVNLIRGNVLRGGVYPLCVGAERVVQAIEIAKIAGVENVTAIAHGSTGAGNDQLRFDVAVRVLAPGVELITPIRAGNIQRADSTKYLTERGHTVPNKTTSYSINRGMWGITIGGVETHDSWLPLPDDAYVFTRNLNDTPDAPEEITIGFETGIPVSLNGKKMNGVELVETIGELGAKHGIGRGMHVGTTVMNIKGRVAFEAPAPAILIPAHRELEKLVLTKLQSQLNAQMGETYGTHLHEGRFLDPAMRDIEKFLETNQQNVTGEVRVRLHKATAFVLGARSEFSLLGRGGTYGESSGQYSGADAAGYCKVAGLEMAAAHLARAK